MTAFMFGSNWAQQFNKHTIIEIEIYLTLLVVAFLLFPKWLAFYPKIWKICEKHLILEPKVQ